MRTTKPQVRRASKSRKRIPTVYEQLRPFIGIIKDLPPDFSINHDHYLYGATKRK
jgi:hypothetical protein